MPRPSPFWRRFTISSRSAIVVGVVLFLALGDAEERRLRDVDVAGLDQLGHLPVEERQQQRADVRAVDVGVGHDDDLVIARLVDLELFLDAAADRGDDRADFLVRQHLVDARLLDVDDLAAQRQDRLEVALASLLGRAAGRVALDEIELAERGIGELSSRRACRAGCRRRAPTCVA